jgi:glycosyltransferase involved in cell wall biosynthesis
MKLIFDYSAFVMQARGGVTRRFYELFRHIARNEEVVCKLFAGFHRNRYLKEAPKTLRRHIVGVYLPAWMMKHRIFMPLNRALFKCYSLWFKPDICHLTWLITPGIPPDCKVVITVHDMIHELFPEQFAPDDRSARWKQQAVARADGIICVSDNTKKDLGRFFDLSRKKVTVIHHGSSLTCAVPEKFEFPSPYLLYVGSRKNSYKNFDLVLRAFCGCVENTTAHLICFGGGPFSPLELERIDQLSLTSRVHQAEGDDAVLAGCYAGAGALIYPSQYEGFGLPPVEAMGMGCPVISSNAPPMPELLGDAALFFDPDDPSQLCERIHTMNSNPVRDQYVAAGLQRATMFSWNKAADEARLFYLSLLS